MSNEYSCHYFGRTTQEEFSEIRELLKDFDKFSVEYDKGITRIFNDYPANTAFAIEDKLMSFLKEQDSTVVFSYIVIANDNREAPFYGNITKNGYEAIDIEHYLQKIADDRQAQLEHQKNAPHVSM